MRTIAVDWATRKEIVAYDGKDAHKIPNSTDAVAEFLESMGKEKCTFVFEAGGGDFFKALAFRAGHKVFFTAGINSKRHRDANAVEKDDVADAVVLHDLFLKGTEGTVGNTSERTEPVSSPSSLFHTFIELDASLAMLRILYRAHELAKQESVREQNRVKAFKKQYQLCNVPAKDIKTMVKLSDEQVKLYKKKVDLLTRQILRALKSLPIWNQKWKSVKGFGPVIVGGLVAELGRCRAENKSQLRKYTGMVPRKKGDPKIAARFKVLLYFAVDQIIKQRTPVWRGLYDATKEKIRAAHPDFSKGKVEGYTRRVLMTKLAIEFWRDMKHYGLLGGTVTTASARTEALSSCPAPIPKKVKRTGRTRHQSSERTITGASSLSSSIEA